ncbi:MAG: DNA replication/repair protein RecF [Pseudobdellovibrionaceae bacterium]
MTHITRLRLTHFRNHGNLALDDLETGFVALIGTNGAGKTNILEAISLLVPGRGIRGAKVAEMQQMGNKAPWGVAAHIESPFGEIALGTGADANFEKRKIQIKGEIVRAQTELAEYLSAVWLTPQMDGLFLEGTSDRRRFFDRLVLSHDAAHAGRVKRYENALSERSKLLRMDDKVPDPLWLDALEAQIAETGIAVAASRLEYLDKLKSAISANAKSSESYFPVATLALRGAVEESLLKRSATETEENFKALLKKGRDMDSMTGGAGTGPHRTDLEVIYARKNMPASQCSTGEQKALLIGIILAHGWLMRAETGEAPLYLLDEIAAHLDESRRNALYALLAEMGGQVWLTGTDAHLFVSDTHKFQLFSFDGELLRKQA